MRAYFLCTARHNIHNNNMTRETFSAIKKLTFLPQWPSFSVSRPYTETNDA